jgi:hypothetical protein
MEKDNWYIVGNHWTRCEIISNVLGLTTVRLYNEGGTRTGKARRGLYGLLVEAKP